MLLPLMRCYRGRPCLAVVTRLLTAQERCPYALIGETMSCSRDSATDGARALSICLILFA